MTAGQPSRRKHPARVSRRVAAGLSATAFVALGGGIALSANGSASAGTTNTVQHAHSSPGPGTGSSQIAPGGSYDDGYDQGYSGGDPWAATPGGGSGSTPVPSDGSSSSHAQSRAS